MTYSIKYASYSPSSEYLVIATDMNGRETFIGSFWSREAAEDKCDELQDAYDHGTNYFLKGDE